MLRITVMLIFLCIPTIGQGQNEHADLLDKAIHLHNKEKDIDGAITLLDSVWNSCKSKSGTSEGCFKILTYLSFYYRINGAYDEALEHYLMMIEYDNVGIHHSRAYNYLAQVLNNKRNHSLALEMTLKGYNHEKTDCKWKHNLAHTAAKTIGYLGDSTLYEQGLAYVDTSLVYYKKCGSGNPKTIVNRLLDKGNLLLKMDKRVEAIKVYERCEKLLDKSDKYAPQKFRVLNNIGAAQARLGNHEIAIEYYKRSVDIYKDKEWNYELENLSILYRNMARISRKTKDHIGALEWVDKSDEYLDECLQSDSSLLIAINQDRIWNQREEVFNYAKLYETNKNRQDLEMAYTVGKSALNLYLIQRSMVFGDKTKMIDLQEIKSTWDQLVKVCLELGKMNEAFYICEKTKYLNLLQHLDHFDSSSIDRLASQLQLIPTSVQDLKAIVDRNKKVDVFLDKEIKLFAQALKTADSPVIYSYYLLKDRYLMFVYKNGDIQVEYLEEAEKIDSMIVTFLSAIKVRKPIDSVAQILHDFLLPNREIKDTSILIVPHGQLEKLPFAALKHEEHFLIKDIEIDYKKSLLIPEAVYQSKRRLGILPKYEGSLMNSKLPFAEGEAEFLRDQFKFELLQENEATVDNLKNMNTELDVMHLIGHCTMDTHNYGNSFFSLSNEEKWTPLDILNSSLKSNLLVLSACATSDGEFNLEEGIRGISYVFNIIGNNNQITTSWSIDDEANFTIFKSFYHHLNEKNTVGQALRLSQLEYLENASNVLSHPYFWAGMRYEGDPSLKIEMSPSKNKLYLFFAIGALLFLLSILLMKRINFIRT